MFCICIFTFQPLTSLLFRVSHVREIFALFPGLQVRETEQHAWKWLWQHVQWLRDGWFRVRAPPRDALRAVTGEECAVIVAVPPHPTTDCAGEGGWGAAAGWEKVAPFQSWIPLKRSRTSRSPARRMSSARPSRSPRTSRSCCEPLRRTNTTGRCLKDKNLLLFHVFFSVINLNLFNCAFSPLVISHCTVTTIPASPRPTSPYSQQAVWAWRRTPAQAQPGMLQHSGPLGRESSYSPPPAQPPSPWPLLLVLWPLSLPPRHSVLFLSLTPLDSPACLLPVLLTSIFLSLFKH